jgi:lipoprotein NlpD
VRAGDTLTSISRDTGVSVERLSALNNISNPSLIRVGQRLRLNDSASLTAAPAGTGASSSSMARSRMGDESSDAQSTASSSSSQTVTRANDAARIDLGWPAKGEIIQRFTAQTKGIDIAGKVGEPVVAAGAGKVVYAGDGVRGLGNLVIIDHGDGFITAYAHNDNILVKSGDAVKKGAQIATMGQSDAASPRLHFEVRRQGTPVDPMRYLPPQS